MRRREFLASAAALAAAPMAVPTSAEAQARYPARTIKVVSPFAPGGGTDYMARAMSQQLADANKWTVVVENKPGANGTVALGETARADPAGYDLVVGQTDNLVMAPLVNKVAYDSVKDFTPIALFAQTPLIFLVADRSPHKTFQDVMAAARAAPGILTVGSSGTNSSTHLAAELLRLRAGMQLRHVPYRGSSPALTDLLGGHLDLVGSSIASAIALIRSGDVRPIAATGAARSTLLPQVPTLAEIGIPGIAFNIWYGLLGPARLPDDVRAKLNEESNKALRRQDVIAALGEQGLEAVPETPQVFADTLKRDYERWSGIIAELGIRRE